MSVHRDVGMVEACSPEIGRWLWGLDEVRKGTLKAVTDCPPDAIDWRGADGAENSIGTLLYHVAIVEASWILFDVMQQPFSAELRELLPWAMGDPRGRMQTAAGRSLAEHLNRLAAVRAATRACLTACDLFDWRRPRRPADGADEESTPAWVVFHLIEHEAGHAFQIKSLRARWTRLRMGGSWSALQAARATRADSTSGRLTRR